MANRRGRRASAPVICRELTKLHEEVARGTLAELAERFADSTRGELVIVVAGAERATVSFDDALAQVRALTASGARLKEATTEVAEATGLSRRELYEAALRVASGSATDGRA